MVEDTVTLGFPPTTDEVAMPCRWALQRTQIRTEASTVLLRAQTPTKTRMLPYAICLYFLFSMYFWKAGKDFLGWDPLLAQLWSWNKVWQACECNTFFVRSFVRYFLYFHLLVLSFPPPIHIYLCHNFSLSVLTPNTHFSGVYLGPDSIPVHTYKWQICSYIAAVFPFMQSLQFSMAYTRLLSMLSRAVLSCVVPQANRITQVPAYGQGKSGNFAWKKPQLTGVSCQRRRKVSPTFQVNSLMVRTLAKEKERCPSFWDWPTAPCIL